MNVAAVDPGTTNIAAWVGTFDQAAGKVVTITMIHGAPVDPDADPKVKPKKKAVYELTADHAEMVADICDRAKVVHIIVETAPQWNTPARISAASAYGVLRGRKLPVSFSSSVTKSRAMLMFADKLGIADKLEKVPEDWDRKDKVVAAKIRLINKRNSAMVVETLLTESKDVEGLRVYHSGVQKHDMADALLLACGGVMKAVRKPRVKKDALGTSASKIKAKPRTRKPPKERSPLLKKKRVAVAKKVVSVQEDNSDTEDELIQ